MSKSHRASRYGRRGLGGMQTDVIPGPTGAPSLLAEAHLPSIPSSISFWSGGSLPAARTPSCCCCAPSLIPWSRLPALGSPAAPGMRGMHLTFLTGGDLNPSSIRGPDLRAYPAVLSIRALHQEASSEHREGAESTCRGCIARAPRLTRGAPASLKLPAGYLLPVIAALLRGCSALPRAPLFPQACVEIAPRQACRGRC